MSALTGKSTWDGGDVANQNQLKADQMRNLNITANRADQVGPDGSIAFTTGPGGQLVKTTTLSPDGQTTYNNTSGAQAQLSGGLEGILGKGIDTSNMTGWQNVIGPGSTDLMTHDWLASAGNPKGTAVAAPGTPQASAPDTGPTFNWGGAGAAGGVVTSGGGFGQAGTTPAAPAVDPYHVRDTFSTDGVTAKLPTTIDDASRQRVEEALMSRLNPSLDKDTDALRNRLLNSGIEVGTDAYNREMTLDNQKRNDARMQAVLAGGQEEDRQTKLLQGLNDQQFQQALATGKFGQDADVAMANNATSRSNAATAAGATLGAAGIASSGALDRLKMQLDQESKEFNVNTGFKAADFNNNLRNQQLAEQVLLRSEPLKELDAMNKVNAGLQPHYDNSYYTNSAQPAVQGPPQQQNSGNGLFDVVGGANKIWNLPW